MTATSDALQISTSKFFNIWLLKWHQSHECGAININCSAQAGLHWTLHEKRATMKLWRFWRMQNLGCTNVSTRAGRSFRSPTASSKTQLQPQILILPLLYLRHEAPRFARGATQLLVRSLDWWCGLHVSRALGRIGTKMQTSARTNLDSVLLDAELKEHVSHLGSFLAQSVMFRPRKRHSISEPSGVSFQPFCLLQVSGVIMLLLGTSWFKPRKIEIKPRSPCAVWQGQIHRVVSFHAGIAQVPSHLDWSIGFAHRTRTSRCCMAERVAPTFQAGNALALAYTCWKSDNSWAGQWGVLLCLEDPKGMNMSTVWKRRTCFYLLPFCLPFWAAFMTLSFKTVLNILTWVPSHLKSKESDDCVHWVVHVWNMLSLLNSTTNPRNVVVMMCWAESWRNL